MEPPHSASTRVLTAEIRHRVRNAVCSRSLEPRVALFSQSAKSFCSRTGFTILRPQGLKPRLFCRGVARLKSCPDTEREGSFCIVLSFMHWVGLGWVFPRRRGSLRPEAFKSIRQAAFPGSFDSAP